MARFVHLLVILTLIVAFAEAGAKKKKKNNANSKTCPNFDNLANYANPEELVKIQDKGMDSLWATKVPDLTDLGDDLEDVLFDMADSRVPFWRTYALGVSKWIWVYLPDMDKNLNFCAFARLINATADFRGNEDCPELLNAIGGITSEFELAGGRLIENTIKNSGCSGAPATAPKAATPPTTCYKDGFAYELDDIWDDIGWEYPCDLQQTVKAMYYSSDKRDKIMALMATANLTKYLQALEAGYGQEILNKIFSMYTFGKVPKCCCTKFVKDVMDVGAAMQKKNAAIFKATRDLSGCPTPPLT